MQAKLDEVTERWGVKVTTVEIREITPPKEVQDAMNRQMSAERTRRALVTEADGKKQAAITIAEGEKQSKILSAEGDRQAAILRAEGFSLALDRIFSVAKNVDLNTMSLQYLDTLKSLGQSPATKIVFPMEFTRLLQPFLDVRGGPRSGAAGARTARVARRRAGGRARQGRGGPGHEAINDSRAAGHARCSGARRRRWIGCRSSRRHHLRGPTSLVRRSCRCR